MGSILKQCEPLCQAVPNDLKELLYRGADKPHGVFVYGDQSQKDITRERDQLVRVVRQLVANSKKPVLYILNTMGKGKSGEMSYPNFGGSDKTLHHPNIHELAVLFEKAQADVRVLVLLRNTHEMRLSDVEHRHFGSEAHELAVLADNAAVLNGQLSLMDRDFFACARYHLLGDATQWRDVIAPTIHPTMAQSAAAMAKMYSSKDSAEEDVKKMDVFELHLESMNSLLYAQCDLGTTLS
jgi:hypothetical protein